MEGSKKSPDQAQVKSKFLADMSHEIQKSMKNILNHSDLIKKTDLSARQADHIDAISSSAHKLSWIVNDILDFSKLESGKIALQSVDFNLEYLINDLFKKVVGEKKDQPVDTYVDIDEDVPCNLIGDPTRLRQVLVNLLSNAFKFTSEGEIGIVVRNGSDAASSDKACLRISIKDSGCGIAKDRLESIFELHSQGEPSESWEYGGTGLGLAICKLIVDAMDGTITVLSEEEKGSEFVVEFSFERGASPGEVRVYPLTREELAGKRAIIVDDNEIARKILNKCCETMKIEVLLNSASPEAVLQMVKDLANDSESADLILCDIMMPEMDGYELARRIRANDKYADIKMIAVTSAMRVGEARNAQKSGFNGFLPKPVFLDELAKVIATVLGDQRENGAIVTRHMAEELNLKGAEVLVLEKNISDQKLIKECFDVIGCEGEFFDSREEAVESLKVKPYDLCLIAFDIFTEDEEAARMIKDVGENIPMVALIPEAMKENREHCLEVGIDDFIVKPVDVIGLKRIVTRYGKNSKS